ncbi:MAG: alpha/beta fold hydrolase [Paraburkholderia sp.]|uniref:alpha/beta fold hydrolase n=1 Tax=Paraburkholderia sp. TaxID=1926495 RepID=UPI003979F7CC
MNLKYDDVGQGTPVVLVHGLGGTGNVFGAQVAALSPSYRVVVPDLRGCGRSDKGPVSIEALVADVIELIDGAGFESVHLVGHSLGSVIVQRLALEHPQMVRSVALIGPIQAAPEAAKTAIRDRADLARKTGVAGIADATVRVGTSQETKRDHPELAAFVRELVMRQDPEMYAQTCEMIIGLEPAEIENLAIPALVVTGDQDATSPPATAKAIADKIPGSKYVEIPECGHWTPIEKAAAVNELLLEFLAKSNA